MNFIVCTSAYCYEYEMKEFEIIRACSTCRGDMKNVCQIVVGKREGRESFGRPDINGMVILK